MLEVLRNIIAVVPLDDPDRYGSIIIPEKGKQRPDQGIVKYRGPLCKQVRTGDYIFFNAYTGTKVSIEGEPYPLLFMTEDDILFITVGESNSLIPLEVVQRTIARTRQEHPHLDATLLDRFDTLLNDALMAEGLEF